MPQYAGLDIGLFLLGALGALLTVYLAKQEVIPEFRPLFDTTEKEKEARRYRDHIEMTEKHIDDIEERLEKESLPRDEVARLEAVINTRQSEFKAETTRLEGLEREIKQNQVISRGLGFLFYIVLGGVFGALLTGLVHVEGWTGDLPKFFQSIVIGATWTSYLSTIGFRSGQKKADEVYQASLQETAMKIDALKKDITDMVVKEVAKAETSERVEQPVFAYKVAAMVGEKLDLAGSDISEDLNVTRQVAQKYAKGIL
jgi:hypothetical protein